MLTTLLAVLLLSVAADVPAADDSATELATDGTQFTLNGRPTFLLGFSYYGALSAPEEFIRSDLDDFQRHGFRWLRVWATWRLDDQDVSALTADGESREPYLGKLKWIVAECDRRGMVVDITLTRGKAEGDAPAAGCLTSFAAHRRGVELLVSGLGAHRNWYLDLANERDVRDARYVPATELKRLRERVRQIDPRRLVTASFGGHDLSEADVRQALETVGVDLLCPHRPRHAASPAQTAARTRDWLGVMQQLGHVAPVHYQEPFRRGYGRWEPLAEDFLTDLRGAVAGGAAGWCFHNGQQRGAADDEPRRSFDLRRQRLLDQLDDEERQVVQQAAAACLPVRASE